MEMNEHSGPFAGDNLGGQRHICAFFNTMDEEHRVLRSFYKDGFDRGEKATHIVDAENREKYLKRLAEAGINVQEMMDTGQLEVLPWDRHVRARPPVRPGCHAGFSRKTNPIGCRCRLRAY
jgi:DcmR-like sensory protein